VSKTSLVIDKLMHHQNNCYAMDNGNNTEECKIILDELNETLVNITRYPYIFFDGMDAIELNLVTGIAKIATDSCYEYINDNKHPSRMALEMFHQSISDLIDFIKQKRS